MFPVAELGEAASALLRPEVFALLLAGTGLGLVIGLLPGLGGVVGMSLLLPFLYGMDPLAGMVLLVSMIAVTSTSDTYSSVLIGVPGTAGSQATIMDGYPLARQGQAARALSAAFLSSMIGGVIGAVTLFLILGIARPLILVLESPQLFMLTLFGLTMVAVLARGAVLPGIMSGLFGMWLGTIGMAPSDAVLRFDFGTLYLYDGVPFAVTAMGLFAIPELMDLILRRSQIAESGELVGSRKSGIIDVLHNKYLVLRSSIVGVFVGVVPGLGGSVVDWITYGLARQTSKNSENFGSGDIRGVIAPESANNAKEGGALVPTLFFGIPGSAAMAVMLTGMLLLGVTPGPGMLSRDLDSTLVIIIALVAANVLGAGASFGISSIMAKISLISAKRLVPILLVILVVGAYQSSRSAGDLVMFIGVGLLGWLFKRLGWPRPPLLIGLALSTSSERYLGRTIALHGWNWVTNPWVIFIAVLCVLIVVIGTRGSAIDTEKA